MFDALILHPFCGAPNESCAVLAPNEHAPPISGGGSVVVQIAATESTLGDAESFNRGIRPEPCSCHGGVDEACECTSPFRSFAAESSSVVFRLA